MDGGEAHDVESTWFYREAGKRQGPVSLDRLLTVLLASSEPDIDATAAPIPSAREEFGYTKKAPPKNWHRRKSPRRSRRRRICPLRSRQGCWAHCGSAQRALEIQQRFLLLTRSCTNTDHPSAQRHAREIEAGMRL